MVILAILAQTRTGVPRGRFHTQGIDCAHSDCSAVHAAGAAQSTAGLHYNRAAPRAWHSSRAVAVAAADDSAMFDERAERVPFELEGEALYAAPPPTHLARQFCPQSKFCLRGNQGCAFW